MVGRNGFSTDDSEIESLWRQAKADALAALETCDERAALQAFPQRATDFIPVYEEILGIESDPTIPDQQRRDTIVPDYTGVPEAWTSALLVALQRIDPTVTIYNRAWVNAGACMIGRAYAPLDPGDPAIYDDAGVRLNTVWPNPSDAHTLIISYPLDNGAPPNREQQRLVRQMLSHAKEVCPAWVEFHVVYAVGFSLDLSRLDATAFGT
jgi:hypothetical protein